KSRMDQRTRERLPLLPVFTAAVDNARAATAQRLTAAQATQPGQAFTANGQVLRRAVTTRAPANIWAEDPAGQRRRHLTRESERAFWAWAGVEVLRLTGGFSGGQPADRAPNWE